MIANNTNMEKGSKAEIAKEQKRLRQKLFLILHQ